MMIHALSSTKNQSGQRDSKRPDRQRRQSFFVLKKHLKF
jgi:hypothetical protein